MKTQQEIEEKLDELKISLKILEQKCFFLKKTEKLEIEFLKNNISFIEWTLDIPRSYCKNNE